MLSQGQDLRTLLATIDRAPTVTGSLLVGYDGLIIAFTLPPTVDRDYLAAQACNMFTGSSQHMQQLERGELRRMVLETATGAMLMTAADMGILVVVSDGQAMDVRGVSAAIAGALGQG
ncbi:Roadblock/LC7 domain protein [compost metagenome]